MNDMLTLLTTRRSIRKYQSTPIKEEELQAILEAGTYAPTAMGQQSPIIVSIENKELRDRISKLNASIMGSDHDPYYGAPIIILVFAPKDKSTHIQDASCVLLNMMLAAHSFGIGTCWINREKEMFETAQGQALMKEWGINTSYEGVGALVLGYPDGDAPKPKERKADYIRRIQ